MYDSTRLSYYTAQRLKNWVLDDFFVVINPKGTNIVNITPGIVAFGYDGTLNKINIDSIESVIEIARLIAERGGRLENAEEYIKSRRLGIVPAVEIERLLNSMYAEDAILFLIRSGSMDCDLFKFSELEGCTQDAKNHPEGDVLTHTLQVFSSLKSRGASSTLLWAGLFHDLGKPASRKEVDGKITFHGHEKLSAEYASAYLGPSDLYLIAAKVAGLCRLHMRLSFLSREAHISDKAWRNLIRDMKSHNVSPYDLLDLYISDTAGRKDGDGFLRIVKERIFEG